MRNKNYTIGSWITLDNIAVAEVMSKSGFDWLCIDLEHTVIDYKELQILISQRHSQHGVRMGNKLLLLLGIIQMKDIYTK